VSSGRFGWGWLDFNMTHGGHPNWTKSTHTHTKVGVDFVKPAKLI